MGKPIGSSEGAGRSLVIPNRRKPERNLLSSAAAPKQPATLLISSESMVINQWSSIVDHEH
jgi:hypothetical protein